MKRIRTCVYAALLALTAMNITPSIAVAEEPARGKFTLTHDVHWGNALVHAGDYEFSYDPFASSPVLMVTKLSGVRARFMLLVINSEESKASDSNQLLLETLSDGSYVSAMQLAECGMTLRFNVPSHVLKQMAKEVSTVVPSGQ